jgi:hypothetical protein
MFRGASAARYLLGRWKNALAVTPVSTPAHMDVSILKPQAKVKNMTP